MINKIFGAIVDKGNQHNREKMVKDIEKGIKSSGLATNQQAMGPSNNSYLEQELTELNNKFMALCDHLGVYIARPSHPKYTVEKLNTTIGCEEKLAPQTTAFTPSKIRQR